MESTPNESTEARAPIPFSPPDIREEDIQAVVDVLRSGWITSGPVGRQMEAEMCERSGAAGALLTSSATTAAETALRMLGVGPGDEVLTSAYTYTASASVVEHVGATIRLVDTAPGEFVPSVEAVAAAVTPATKAVVTVDLGGVLFDHVGTREALGALGGFTPASPLQETLGRVAVVADAAHSLGATRGDQRSGSAADMTTFSFHAVKNLTTAEGGALSWRAIEGADPAEMRRAAQLKVMHGQTKDALAKTKVGAWEYDIVELGHKCNMPDVLAALALSQYQRYAETVDRRHEIVKRYQAACDEIGFSALQHEGEGWRSSAHLFLALLPEGDVPGRNRLIEELGRRGVSTNVHYKPLPLLSAYQERGFSPADFPNAIAMYEREITLPLHTKLSDADVERVCTELVDAARTLGLAR